MSGAAHPASHGAAPLASSPRPFSPLLITKNQVCFELSLSPGPGSGTGGEGKGGTERREGKTWDGDAQMG